jgi:hypothetical protein
MDAFRTDGWQPSRDEIERRAYERFVRRGRVNGADVDDWLAAEQELLAVQSDDVKLAGTGISNRETARQEDEERRRFPAIESRSPEPQDAAGRVGEQPLEDTRDRHTSHKAGSRSIAQKEAASQYADRSMPATRKVDGAFGKEPKELQPELEDP